MEKKFHSVRLLAEKCIGCTDCLKRCPTEAIRIRNGKAEIMSERCIDCGLCIKVCQSHAKKATTDPFGVIYNYKYKVAIPAPTLYGQFKNLYDVNTILTGIKQLGFDEVFEVSYAAEMVTEATKKMLAEKELKRPIISSACPAIIRLISMRFPALIGNILPVIAPVEVAAVAAKNYLEKHGIPRSDIGVFFISPCAAKNTYMHNTIGIEKSEIDAVISMQDIYVPLRNKLKSIREPEILSLSSEKGIDWALTGGESKSVKITNAIAVDSVENVINVLEQIEDGQLTDVEFIEGLACTSGCVGGPLTIENSFVAKGYLRRLENVIKDPANKKRKIDFSDDGINYEFTKAITRTDSFKLDNDVEIAISKLEAIEKFYEELPRIDCGSCGAPTCRALAEDIANGNSNIEDCIFMLKKKVKILAEAMSDLSSKLSQTFSTGIQSEGRDKND